MSDRNLAVGVVTGDARISVDFYLQASFATNDVFCSILKKKSLGSKSDVAAKVFRKGGVKKFSM